MEGEKYYVIIPLGFRYSPTDEQIITRYLLNKVMNKPFPALEIRFINKPVPPFEVPVISEYQLYNQPPHRVADVNLFNSEDWFFICPHNKIIHGNGGTNLIRIVGNERGYWRSRGTEKPIFDKDHNIIGFKNSLVYHSGAPFIGRVTPWVMEEYRLSEEFHEQNIKAKDLWIMGRIRWDLYADEED